MNLSEFEKQPIIGILRGIKYQNIELLIETIISSGLKTIEITMNTPDAPRLLLQAKKIANNRLTIGAGTVLNTESLKSALDSGATFIVSPVLIDEVITFCLEHNIAVFPGALTPTEIYAAWIKGVTMVKVFPSKFFGPAYLKEIKGPFEKIKLLACGGVQKENLKVFFASGADAVAFGSSIFKPEWIGANRFALIEEKIRSLISELSS